MAKILIENPYIDSVVRETLSGLLALIDRLDEDVYSFWESSMGEDL